MGTLGSAAASGARITLLTLAGRFVLQIIALMILARLLSPEDFGLVAMVTAVLGVAEIIRDFGLSSAAIQAKVLTGGERTNLFWANLGIGSACAVIAAACSPLIASLYGEPVLVPITLALSWLFVVSGANTQFRAELSRSLRFAALAKTDVSAQLAGVVTAVSAAALGAGFWSIVLQQAVFVVMTCLMNVYSCPWRPGRPQRGVSLRRYFKFGGALLGMQLMGYATNNADNVAIGIVWGPAEVGLYSRAYQLLMAPLSQVSNALLRVVLPVMSRVQDDEITYQRYVKRAQLMCNYGFGLGFAIVAGLAVPLVAILFGPDWSGLAPIFALLAIGGIFRGLAQTTYWICLSKGLTGTQLRFYAFARPFMIVLILCGLPWGAVGVAATHTTAFMLEWAASLWWIGRSAKIATGPLLAGALRAVVLVCAPAGLLAFLGSAIAVGPVLQIGVGFMLATCFLAVLMWISPTERSDAKLLYAFARAGLQRGA